MPSDYRIEQIENLIQELLAELIAKDFCTSRDKIISVTKVTCSGNLQEAKVQISVIPDREQKGVLGELCRSVAFFQGSLNKKMRMRPVPKIIFVADNQAHIAQEVETILEQLKDPTKD